MKKLLFSLVAAGACGGVIAAPGIATFENYGENAFSVELKDDGTAVGNDSGYWSINMTSDPELTLTAYESPADGNAKYLQINTGSTPLWRTFGGVNASDAVAGTIPAGEPADGKIVSSKVKLTACTEWPDLTDFAAKGDDPGEKLALFLFAKEEGDTSNKEDGLYAVGGKQTDSGLQPEAYLLTGANVTAGDWVTVTIKTYGDINKTSGNDKLPGFVVAVNNTVLKRSVATGLSNDDLNPTVAARNTIGSEAVNGTLIPAIAYTTSANLQGLGFQGEGGIDDVNLAALEVSGMADAVAMTVDLTDATLTDITGAKVPSLSADGNLEFDPGTKTITFRVSAAEGMVVTVKLGNDELTATDGVYSFTPAANAALTVTAAPAAFQIGDAKYYATLADALKDLKSGDTLKLLGTLSLGTQVLAFTTGDVTIDLNGQTISGSGNENDGATVIMNSGANLVITDSSVSQLGNITANNGAYAIWNAAGTLTVNKGIFNGAIFTDDTEGGAEGTATINGGKFSVKVEAATIPGDKQWSDLTEDYYTLVDKSGSGDNDPVIEDAIDDVVGKVEETTDEQGNKTATVTVTNASTSVTIQVPTGYQGTVKVVVPPTVDTITGLGAATLTVTAEGVDITGAFSKTTDAGVTTLALDPEGEVVIDGETIKVEPQLVEDTTAEGTVAPFEVPADGAEANVAAIPGLTYELVTTDDLDVEFGSIVEDGEVVSGAKVKATGKRVNLKDNRKGPKPGRGFYKVKVTK